MSASGGWNAGVHDTLLDVDVLLMMLHSKDWKA